MLVFVLGQFIYLTHSLSLWHCFSVVEMHPKASPSGIGFSKLECNSENVVDSYLLSLLLHRTKGICLCGLEEDCVPGLQTAKLNPYCAQEVPPLVSPLRESLGLVGWEDFSFFS